MQIGIVLLSIALINHGKQIEPPNKGSDKAQPVSGEIPKHGDARITFRWKLYFAPLSKIVNASQMVGIIKMEVLLQSLCIFSQ